MKEQQGLEVTPEKVRLGRMLYFDTRLSADNTISCATCHRPESAFSEPTPVSTGIGGQKGDRKAPPTALPSGSQVRTRTRARDASAS